MEITILLSYTFLAICTFFLLLLGHLLHRRTLKRRPPGPPGIPFLGNLLQLGSKPHESLRQLSAEYGDIMSLSMGSKTIIAVSSPAVAKEVLTTYDSDLAGRDPVEAARALGHNERALAMGQPRKHWRMLRRISAMHLFSRKKLQSLCHLRRSQICFTLEEIYGNAKQSKCVEVRDIVSRFAISLLGKVFFGKDMLNPQSASFSEFRETLCRALECIARLNLSDFLPFFSRFDPQRIVRDTEIYLRKLYDIIDSLMQNRLAEQKRSAHPAEEDLLDTLLALTSSDFSVADIRIYFCDLFAAGTDTTAITIEWAIAELIKNPSLMQKAQAEIEDLLGGHRLVEESDIEKLPYLQAVVKETLRLHPPGPFLIPHRAQRNCEINGFVIPKDAQVLINYWAISRDPTIWKEPSEFQPERFLEKDVDFRGKSFELIPFGSGRRICAGLPLADLMVHSVLGALIQCFDWSLPDGTPPAEMDMNDKLAITLHKATPLQAVPIARLQFAGNVAGPIP